MNYNFKDPREFDRALRELEQMQQEEVFKQDTAEMCAKAQHN